MGCRKCRRYLRLVAVSAAVHRETVRHFWRQRPAADSFWPGGAPQDSEGGAKRVRENTVTAIQRSWHRHTSTTHAKQKSRKQNYNTHAQVPSVYITYDMSLI